ncbi:MAG: alcohol dehydrogenase catalytic domain-containing protein [Thermoplasmatales archaeon]
MRAIVTYPPSGGVKYTDIPKEQGSGVLVKTLFTGICGTDKELTMGKLSFARVERGNFLVLGHEAVGKVADAGDSRFLKAGDLVVPMVRRPGGCRMCKLGRQDYCEDGDFVEAGIRGKNGFMMDEFYDDDMFLLKVDQPEISELSVLTEPLKNAMKIREVFNFMSSRIPWWCDDSTLGCKNIYVFGTGTEGILISLVFKVLGLNVIAVNRHPLDENVMSILDNNGIEYLDKSSESLKSRVSREKMDAAVDAVGSMDILKDISDNISNNGIAILFGTNGQLPSSKYDVLEGIVDKNVLISGSVDGARVHYHEAITFIENYGKKMGLGRMITGKYAPQETEIFQRKDSGEIKKVIEWT